jgi:hypothetical protein
LAAALRALIGVDDLLAAAAQLARALAVNDAKARVLPHLAAAIQIAGDVINAGLGMNAD